MPPADFTIEFYRKCLSQMNWGSLADRDIESLNLLEKVANERGGQFQEEFNAAYYGNQTILKHFPVA